MQMEKNAGLHAVVFHAATIAVSDQGCHTSKKTKKRHTTSSYYIHITYPEAIQYLHVDFFLFLFFYCLGP